MGKNMVFIIRENILLMLRKSRDYGQLKFIKCLALYQMLTRPIANKSSSICHIGISAVHMRALKETF